MGLQICNKNFTALFHDCSEYSSITQDGKRPLGFLKSVTYYDAGGDGSLPDPCFSISGLNDMAVEVMVRLHAVITSVLYTGTIIMLLDLHHLYTCHMSF